ncbi:MAG TPA: aminotransferase class I/II-fold pyridoxal phosphate-dependent enzyme, partial [Bacteroidales bacterium]|nr:aminotransferase class I/II-fold pyridoxal phosphate-dependent enzyme [Bacteroidales bacterium]
MPKISEKGIRMPASPIRKLVPYSDEAKKRGIKVYHLNIGQPDIETPKGAIAALQSAKIDVLAYSHSAGTLSCRKKIVEYYKRWNINVTENEIIVTAGGSEAILFAFNTCLDPGDEVIIPEPFYANYNGFAISVGVNVKPIISVIDNGFALPPIEEFEKVITPKTKAIMICNPNNPTGYLYSRQELESLAKIVKKHDLYLF